VTAIIVNYPSNRIDLAQREKLSLTLTDAVLNVECGQVISAARMGFQVHFRPLAEDHVAVGGVLVSKSGHDVMLIELIVMDGHWPIEDRKAIISNVYVALCDALNVSEPAPTWWVNFTVIEEGSWGSRGGVLSILSLLDTGAFTAQRADDIRKSIALKKT
jgi:hypothetical protein